MIYLILLLIAALFAEVFLIRKGLKAGKKHSGQLHRGSTPAFSPSRANKRVKRQDEESLSSPDEFEDVELPSTPPAPIFQNVVEFPDKGRLSEEKADAGNQEKSMLEIIQEIRGERPSQPQIPGGETRGEQEEDVLNHSDPLQDARTEAYTNSPDGDDMNSSDDAQTEPGQVTPDETDAEDDIYEVVEEVEEILVEDEISEDEVEEAEEVPSPEELLKNGIHCVRQGQLERGITALENAVESAPEKAEAHFNLGIAYTLKEAVPQAIAAYQRAIELDSEYGKAYFNLGTLYLKQGKIQDAILKLEHAVKFLHDPMKALWNLYEAYRSSDLFNNALSTLQQLVELEPEDASLHNHLGICHAKLGEYSQAIQAWKHAVSLGASSHLIHYNLGKTHELCGNFDDASQEYQYFLSMSSQNNGWQELVSEVKERLENLERHAL